MPPFNNRSFRICPSYYCLKSYKTEKYKTTQNNRYTPSTVFVNQKQYKIDSHSVKRSIKLPSRIPKMTKIRSKYLFYSSKNSLIAGRKGVIMEKIHWKDMRSTGSFAIKDQTDLTVSFFNKETLNPL